MLNDPTEEQWGLYTGSEYAVYIGIITLVLILAALFFGFHARYIWFILGIGIGVAVGYEAAHDRAKKAIASVVPKDEPEWYRDWRNRVR